MALVASSYIPTSGTIDTRTVERLQLPFAARPQAMSVYVRFVERGTISDVINTKIFLIGASGTPLWFGIHTNGSSQYQVRHRTPSGAVTATLSSTTVNIGDVVELIARLHSDGSVSGVSAVNGALIETTTQTAALALRQTWESAFLYVNSASTSLDGFIAVREIVALAGIHGLTKCRHEIGIT